MSESGCQIQSRTDRICRHLRTHCCGQRAKHSAMNFTLKLIGTTWKEAHTSHNSELTLGRNDVFIYFIQQISICLLSPWYYLIMGKKLCRLETYTGLGSNKVLLFVIWSKCKISSTSCLLELESQNILYLSKYFKVHVLLPNKQIKQTFRHKNGSQNMFLKNPHWTASLQLSKPYLQVQLHIWYFCI